MYLEPETAGTQLWPWTLTPLMARFLGALFIAVAVGALLAAFARIWSHVRPLFPPALVFTGLIIIASVLSISSFTPHILRAIVFFAIYVIAFVLGLAVYIRRETEERRAAAAAKETRRA
jgi:uncharacterized membrane protein YoaK (UPF0700 family)